MICILAAPVAANGKQIVTNSLSGIAMNSTGLVNVSIIAPQSADAFTVTFTYDPGVMKISNRLNDVTGWSLFGTPSSGSYIVAGFANTPANSLSTDTILFNFQCEALRQDGKATFINGTISSLEENAVEKKAEYSTINGTFTSIDVVPPVVTITTPLNGDTVSQDINVTADITDIGGVNVTSIAVTIDGVSATILNTNPITNGYRVNASRTGVALGARNIVVAAQDISNNPNSSTIAVTVAQSGFTFDPLLQGYTNSTSPFVNALFVQVNAATIKMFIDNTDVTASCSITGASTGNISYNLVLPDGAHTIVVNGTSSLTPQEVSATESFVKDSIAPIVIVTSITDSDGDGYAEAGELLSISYTVTDANPYMVGIGTAWNTSNPGTLFYSSTTGNLVGNLNKSVTAIDRAINTNQSSPFHIYNNYLAYINDPTFGSLAGLDLTHSSLYDIFTYANAITIAGPPSHLNFPKLGTFQKTLIGGQNVTLDNRKDNPIYNTSLPSAIDFYPTPSGNLDFSLQVANVTNATIVIGKANSSLINQLSTRSVSAASVNLGQMLAQDTLVMYGRNGADYGYVIINATDPNNLRIKSQVGGFNLTTGDLAKTISDNAVDISTGFNTVGPQGLAPLPISALEKGEYAILAMTIDNGRVGIITLKTFEVTQTANALSTTSTIYDIGDPVIVTSTITGDRIAGVLLKDSPLYTGNMLFNFTTLGTGSLENITLEADGNPATRRLINKIWITPGYGNASQNSNAASVNVPTTGLLAGSYNVYMVLENGGNITALGQTTVTLRASAPTVNFTANATSGITPFSVKFTDTSTGAPTAWNWSFGDGTTSTLQNPVHTYTRAGYYDVSLIVTNSVGSSTITRSGYIQVYRVTTPVVQNATISGNVFSVNLTGNVANYTQSGNNIILTNISGFSQVIVRTTGLNQSGGNLSGTVSSVEYILEPVITDLEGQLVTVIADITKATWNSTCNFNIGISLTNAGQDADYIGNLPAGATGYNPFSVLNITTSGSEATGAVLNISIPYTWYSNYQNAGPTTPGQNFTYVMWTHGTPAVTTPLTPTWGPTDLPYKWFTVQTTGFSTFGMIGATAKSSSPPSPPSPSGGGGGGGGGGGSFTGKIVQFGVPQKPGLTQPAVTITTLIKGIGIAESGPIVADLVGLEGVSAAWSVDITQQPEAGAKIITSIIQEPNAQVQYSYRLALQSMKLDIAQVAYVMEVTKSGISSTGPATISMSIPQSWINNYGGMDAIRIVRMGDDGTSEVLTTTFANYDMNTGYLNFKAISPKGLSTFGLMAVKTYVPGEATPAITPGVTPSVPVTPVQPTSPESLPFTTIIGAVIVVLVLIGIGVYFYTRKHD